MKTDNKGKFKAGTRFIGNVSKIEQEVVEIRGKYVLIRDVKTGMLHVHGLQMLEHCDVTILE